MLVIFYNSVFAFLLGVVFKKSFIKNLVISFFNVLASKRYIFRCPATVNILNNKFSIIVSNTSFSNCYANRFSYVTTTVNHLKGHKNQSSYITIKSATPKGSTLIL